MDDVDEQTKPARPIVYLFETKAVMAGAVSKKSRFMLTVEGPWGLLEIKKMIRLLEAQAQVFDEESASPPPGQ